MLINIFGQTLNGILYDFLSFNSDSLFATHICGEHSVVLSTDSSIYAAILVTMCILADPLINALLSV